MFVPEAEFRLMMGIVGFDTPDVETIIQAAKEAQFISPYSYGWWLGGSYWFACQGLNADEIVAWIYGVSRHGRHSSLVGARRK